MTTIAILGSGFAALTAVRELRRHNVKAEIIVISPRDTLHYLPSTIWIPAGLRTGAALRIALAPFFARHQVRHLPTSVTGLSEDGHTVHTDLGPIEADHVIIATGGRFLRKLPGIEHAIIPCEGIAAGEAIATRLEALEGGTIAIGFASNPKEPGAVRGGPMFEMLFIIDSLLRQQKRRDKFRLVFFNPSTRPGQRLGEKAVDGILAEMARRGVETRLGHKMVAIEPRAVVTEGDRIEADLILFQPGMTGPAWVQDSALPLSPGGMVRADAHGQVEGHAHLWVAGDAGSYPGPDWMPKQAHQADLQARAVAANIAAALAGRPARQAFRTELICIMDTLDAGMLVYRNRRLNLVLPRLKPLHWLKRYFESLYLKAYR